MSADNYINIGPLPPFVAGSPYTFYTFLVSKVDPSRFVTNMVLAPGDVKWSKDGVAPQNITNLPMETGTTGIFTINLTAAETSGITKYGILKLSDPDSIWIDEAFLIDAEGTTAYPLAQSIPSIYPYRTIGTSASGVMADVFCDGIDDNVEIQAEIDRLIALPGVAIKRPDGTTYSGNIAGHELHLLRGVYNFTNTVNLKSIVHLTLAPGAIINLMADVDAINLKRGSSIKGGVITAGAHPNYTHDFIRIDGSEHIFCGVGGDGIPMSISDIYLGGSHFGLTGNGIHFLCDEVDEMGYIFGVNVSNVSTQFFEYAIKMEIKNLDQMDNWMACNNFSGISIRTPKYGIGLITPHRYKIGSNTFVGVAIECSPKTVRAIYIEGGHNHFNPVCVVDSPGMAVECGSEPPRNRGAGRLERWIDQSGLNFMQDYSSE